MKNKFYEILDQQSKFKQESFRNALATADSSPAIFSYKLIKGRATWQSFLERSYILLSVNLLKGRFDIVRNVTLS